MTSHRAWGTALLRVTLGGIFLVHGYANLTASGPASLALGVVQTGVSPVLAPMLVWYVIIARLVGGLLLIVGLYTVAVALAQVPVLASSVFLVHGTEGFFLRGLRQDGAPHGAVVVGSEYAWVLLLATLALTLLGAGAPSVDDRRHARRRSKPR